MFAEVVVLTYQSPAVKTYTYKVPKELEEEIKVGQLVTVPFGKRSPYGFVVKLHDKLTSPVIPAKAGIHTKKWIPYQIRDDEKNVQIKNIGTIVLKNPFFLPRQIELLFWMSDYYFTPIINCAQAMIPKIPLHLDYSPSTNYQLQSTNQTLVLVPNINRIPQTMAKFISSKNPIVYHNELSQTQKFLNWQKIISGNCDFVFGTRSAIFTPCPNLKKIIIFDEHESTYKDERSPYFDVLTIAEKIKQQSGCELEIIDSSPKITTCANHRGETTLTVIASPQATSSLIDPRATSSLIANKARFASEARRVNQSQQQIAASLSAPRNDKLPKVQIVSMADEKTKGNKSPISDLLSTYIKLGTKKQKNILLFLNKKSQAGTMFCKNCKFSDHAKKQPEICPNCRSAEILFYSLNVKTLAKQVAQLVPDAQINIIAEGIKTEGVNIRYPTIDIATATVFYRLLSKKYDLVAHIAADSFLSVSDFSTTEKVYSQITDLKKMCLGLLLLQTYNPQDSTINFAAQGTYEKFFTQTIAERKILSFPPSSLLVKLSTKVKRPETAEKKAYDLFEKLNAVNNPLIKIQGPYQTIFSKNSSKYNIIIKIPVSNYGLATREKALVLAKRYIGPMNKDWQIVVEPQSIN